VAFGKNLSREIVLATPAVGMFVETALCGVVAAHIGMQVMFAVTAAGCLVLGFLGTRALR
jgi:hypothetical protein